MKKLEKKIFTRYSFLAGTVIFVLFVIIIRLVYLQIIKVDYYKEYANSKSHKLIEQPAPRGRILDSSGVELATNKQSYVLSFTATDESNQQFFTTMDKVFKILDSENQKFNDDFPIKINPYRFEFDAVDDKGKRSLERIFKNDIGINDEVSKNEYKKIYSEIDADKKKRVDDLVMAYTAKETFDFLVKKYNVPYSRAIGLINGCMVESNSSINGFYNLDEQRKFIAVKYAIQMKSFSGYKTVVLSNIDRKTAFYFSERLNSLPGVFVDIQSQRYYPQQEIGSAFLGYISKISDEKYKEQGYDLSTDYVGSSGIEQALEDRLKGSKGSKVVQVNGKGRVINELANRDAYPGQDVHLTINKAVQEAGEKALDERMSYLQKKGTNLGNNITNATRGAAVAIDVETGGIIALISRPGFNPNDFSTPGGLTTDLYNKYYNTDYEQFGKQKGWTQERIDKMFPKNNNGRREDAYDFMSKPLFNYATSSLIPPGSTFKPLTGIAGLQEGVINKDTTIYDPGYFEIAKGEIKRFPKDKANYNANLAIALENSSNPYFMTVSKLLMEKYSNEKALKDGGVRHKFDALAKYAWKFGLGVDPLDKDANPSTGIEINENFGQVYNRFSNQKIAINMQLSTVMDQLKSGKNQYTNATFPAVDLYYHTRENNSDKNLIDSEEVHNLKKKIKDTITDVMKNGKYDSKQMKKMIGELTKTDPKYKNVSISSRNIEEIDHYLYNYLIYTAYRDVSVNSYNMFNAAIGQGISAFTPLQIADYIATLANGGTRHKLHLVDKVTDADGNLVYKEETQVLDKVNIKQQDLDSIKQGMYLVTQSGTAGATFSNFSIKTAGKTGTADFRQDQEELGRGPFALYVGFAPYDKPKIAICAVIFDGGFGNDTAPVVKSMFEAYFNINK